jgi:hypothetical protein
MAGSRPGGSTTRTLSAWTAPAPTRRKAFSAVCAAPRTATTIICRGGYLDRYAREITFREDHRRTANREQFVTVAGLVARNGPSVDFCGYWQRAKAA